MCSLCTIIFAEWQYSTSTREPQTESTRKAKQQKREQYDGININQCGHGSPPRKDSNLVRRLQDNRDPRAVRSTRLFADLHHLGINLER